MAGNPFAAKQTAQPDPNLSGAPQDRNAPPPADPSAPTANGTPPKEDEAVGQYESFDACVAAQLSDGKDMLSAHRLCGALQDRTPPADPKPAGPPQDSKTPTDPNKPAPDASSQTPDNASKNPFSEAVAGYRGDSITAAWTGKGDHSVPGTTDKSDQGQIAYADTNTAHVNSLKGELLSKHLIDDHGIDDGGDEAAVHAAQHPTQDANSVGDFTETMYSPGGRSVSDLIEAVGTLTEDRLCWGHPCDANGQHSHDGTEAHSHEAHGPYMFWSGKVSHGPAFGPGSVADHYHAPNGSAQVLSQSALNNAAAIGALKSARYSKTKR